PLDVAQGNGDADAVEARLLVPEARGVPAPLLLKRHHAARHAGGQLGLPFEAEPDVGHAHEKRDRALPFRHQEVAHAHLGVVGAAEGQLQDGVPDDSPLDVRHSATPTAQRRAIPFLMMEGWPKQGADCWWSRWSRVLPRTLRL